MAVGGGTSVALMLKNRLIQPDRLVYLGRLADLSGVSEDADGEIHLGAMTTLRQLIQSPLINAKLPVLARAADQVGNPRVRSVATVGGAIVHGDPRQDIPPVLLALGAHAHLVGRTSERDVPLSEFFYGFMANAAGDDELVTEVVVPHDPARRALYSRFTPGSEDDYPTVGVAVALSLADDGRVTNARIALGGVDAKTILAEEAAGLLEGQRPDADLIAAVAAAAAGESDPSDDQRGSTDYKRAMVEVWTRRTVAACLLS